ncbi:hypothetical protein TB1_030277 [Malus domestica]
MGTELIQRHVVRNIGHIYLSQRYVGDVVGIRIPRGGELRDGHAAVNLLTGFLQGHESIVDVAKRDEPVNPCPWISRWFCRGWRWCPRSLRRRRRGIGGPRWWCPSRGRR